MGSADTGFRLLRFLIEATMYRAACAAAKMIMKLTTIAGVLSGGITGRLRQLVGGDALVAGALSLRAVRQPGERGAQRVRLPTQGLAHLLDR
ncbi:hypothetical protein ACVMGC_003672 [Bradyrhizobium barranii subsp. barranii]